VYQLKVRNPGFSANGKGRARENFPSGAHREPDETELGAGKPEVGFAPLPMPSRISPANSEGLLS
jgi:hypothetical protein